MWPGAPFTCVGLLSQPRATFTSEGPRAELRMNEPTKALLHERVDEMAEGQSGHVSTHVHY